MTRGSVGFVWVSVPKQLDPVKREQLHAELLAVWDRCRADGWSAEELLIGLAEETGALSGAVKAIQGVRARAALGGSV